MSARTSLTRTTGVIFVDDDFRAMLRAEFRNGKEAMRKGFQEDKLRGDCDIKIKRDVRRERRNGEYHETETEFHRDSLTELIDKDEGINTSHKTIEGGN